MAEIIRFPRKHYARASIGSAGYKSGRNSCLEMPLTRSTASTRKGGTSSHCETAWADIPSAAPRGPRPPADLIARRSASFLSLMISHESPAFTKSQALLACGPKAQLYHGGMKLGDRIKSVRKQRGMTQAELGARFGISSQAVFQWENDPTKGPQRDRMPELAKILDVPLEWLTGAEELSPAAELATLIGKLPPDLQRQAIRVIRAMTKEGDEAA